MKMMICLMALTTPAGADDLTFRVYLESKSSENMSEVRFGSVVLGFLLNLIVVSE